MYQALTDEIAADALKTPGGAPSTAAARPAQSSPPRTFVDSASMRCLPTCSSTDGRFLAIAGQNLATLSGSELNLQISVPASASSFTVGFFDGDARGVDSAGVSHWDTGVTNAVYEFTLYADPTADGTGTPVVEMMPGSPVLRGSDMPDNAWIDFSLPTSPSARTPSGNFFYHLNIRLTTPTLTTLNAFKVRTNAVLSGLNLDPKTRPFSYIANPTSQADLRILYPSFPATTPTTYDGRFSFFFEVPSSLPSLTLWDGDFDHGKFDGTDLDTDDPDTPNVPFRPAWATADTVPEGAATGLIGTTGNPPDDRNPTGSGIYSLRSPSIRYDLIFPDGQVFANDNPSGNLEWEQFKISTAPFDRSQMDYHTNSIPPGVYELRVQGVDMVNLNALVLLYKVVCVDGQGGPCTLLHPYAVGDTVFIDRDGDRTQEAGEPGIPGVLLELRDIAGSLIATTLTDASGHYRFEVESGKYEVGVAASNFSPSGPLAGSASTTGDSKTDTVNSDNVLTYDFGYQGAECLPTIAVVASPRIPAYWTGQAAAWPVQRVLAGGRLYTRSQALKLLGSPSRGDKSLDLLKQVVSTKLSFLTGSNPACIYTTLEWADAWLAAYPPGSNVSASGAAWTAAADWLTELESYTSGLPCPADHR